MSTPNLKLAPPWITYINKVQALFDGDPQIACNIDYDTKKPSITLACNNGDKVAALQRILVPEVKIGNITLSIDVDGIPTNRAFKNNAELYEVAFEGNPAFAYTVAPVDEGYFYVDFVYVVFKNCVVQFFNDNLNDAHGVLSTLYQDIADEVLNTENTNVHFCTDVESRVQGGFKATGQWPFA